jgi:hypothetical protein
MLPKDLLLRYSNEDADTYRLSGAQIYLDYIKASKVYYPSVLSYSTKIIVRRGLYLLGITFFQNIYPRFCLLESWIVHPLHTRFLQSI